MNKILYDKISLNDNWVLVAQALIDKQAEIVDFINGLQTVVDNSNLYREKVIFEGFCKKYEKLAKKKAS